METSSLLFAAFGQDLHITHLSAGWDRSITATTECQRLTLRDLLTDNGHSDNWQQVESAIEQHVPAISFQAPAAGLSDGQQVFFQCRLLYKEGKNGRLQEGLVLAQTTASSANNVAIKPGDPTIAEVCQRIGLALMLYDAEDQEFRMFNNRYADWTAHPMESVFPKTQILESIYPRDRSAFNNALHRMRDGTPSVVRFRTTDQSGGIQTHLADIQPLQMEGKPSYIRAVLAIQNITFFARHEEYLALQETTLNNQVREKLENLAFVNHEIRNHLHVIQGISDVLLQQPHYTQQADKLHTLSFSAQTMTRLVNDILDLSKLSAGKATLTIDPIDLPTLLNDTCAPFAQQAEKKQLSFSLVIAPDVPIEVEADGLRLHQVLGNLLSNAIKFTHKGWIKVSVEQLAEKEDTHLLRFMVQDTGEGIPAKHLNDIFKAYNQVPGQHSAQKGTGLGLAIVAGLIQLMQGEIKVQSKEGEGTQFTIQLSFTKPKQSMVKSHTAIPYQVSSLEDFSALYVEDQASNFAVMEAFCVPWKVSLDWAASGKEALKKLYHNTYDAVLLDMHLPDTTGDKLAGRISRRYRNHASQEPVMIGVSGGCSPEELHRFRQNGVAHHLAKPVPKEELYQMLQQVYRRKQNQKQKKDVISAVKNIHRMQEDLHPIDFSFIDETFQGQTDRLVKLLELMQVEFSTSKTLIFDALEEKELQQYRDVKHKLLPSLTYLQVDAMRDLLEEIGNALVLDSAAFEFDTFRASLAYYFESIQAGLQQKLNALKA